MIRFANLLLSGRVRTAAVLAAAGLLLAGCVPDRETMRQRLREDNPRVQTATMILGGGKMAPLSAEEGKLADVTNQTAGMRAWNLWRKTVKM